jgi:hypothetical protein
MLDTYGSRISGSIGLNNSLTYMAQLMTSDGFVRHLHPRFYILFINEYLFFNPLILTMTRLSPPICGPKNRTSQT